MTATKYRWICVALNNLSPAVLVTNWQDELRSLGDDDVARMTCMNVAGSEGRKKLSWIWKVHGTGADADAGAQVGMKYLPYYFFFC